MKVVLLNSGGKDSLATALLLGRGEVVFPDSVLPDDSPLEIHSLFIDLGQKNRERAKQQAALMAQELGFASHFVMETRGSWVRDNPIPGRTGIPHQSVTFSVLAAMYAVKQKVRVVASGLVPGPVGSGFADALNALYSNGSKWRKSPVFVMPLMGKKLEEIFDIVKMSPLLPNTVACNAEVPCNACFKCVIHLTWLKRMGHLPIDFVLPPNEQVTPVTVVEEW